MSSTSGEPIRLIDRITSTSEFATLDLDGDLLASFINNFELAVSSDDVFTVLDAHPAVTLMGGFDNVASGARLSVGLDASFLVSYGAGSPFGANKIVLSDFQRVPEPASAIILIPTLFGVFVRRRRGA